MELIDLWVSIEQVLTPEEFRLFEMRYKWGMTFQKIGETVGLHKSNACRGYYATIEKLQKSL